MRYSILYISLILVLLSCKSETKAPIAKTIEVTSIQKIICPVDANSSLVRLFSNGNTLFMSWVEKKDTITTLNYSFYKEGVWAKSEVISSGNDWFVNWADYPVIAENNGNILTSLLQKSASGTYTYDIKLNLYSKESTSWKNNFLLNLDGTQSEHGFVSILPYKKNAFFATWLDGRTTVNVPKGEEQMTLRGAIITNEGNIENDVLLDKRTCDCCNTAATMTPNGPVVVYRDRSSEEIRDIAIVRFENGAWTKPQIAVEDNWYIPGCPVNGPAIDSFDENLALAWFTSANDNPRVQVAFSEDSGKTFGLPFRIDNGNAIGRVDLVMIDANSAVVVWMEPMGVDTVISLARISADGTQNKPITISKTRSERASGFPQLERVGNTLFVAWTSLANEIPTIEVVSLDLLGF